MYNILLVGNGWGAAKALNSLVKFSAYNLHVLTRDSSIKESCELSSIALVDALSEKYDLIICAGWTEKVDSDFLHKKKVLNIHYSLLPAYRGLHSTVWAILNDEPYLGLTIHRMNEYFDDGPIIYQYQIKNDKINSATWYMEHFNSKVEEVLGDIVIGYLSGTILEVKQDKSLASWVGKRNLNDCRINFTKDLVYQKAFFRALVRPYPLPFFEIKNTPYEVTKADFHFTKVNSHYGRVLNIDGDGVWVSCLDGYIVMKEIIDSSTGGIVPYNRFKIGMFIK